jgi:hypothetical protein
MAELPYRFFINPFRAVTRGSYKKMLSIGEDHKAKLLGLQADPEVAAILLTYDPILQSYKTTDQNLQSAEGTYEGKTQTVEEFFATLNREKLPYWEGQIHSIHYEGTPEETSLFPDKRKPFQTGTYEQRISTIKVLGEKCALDANPVIVAVSVNILAFHTQIESARVLQQSQGEAAVANLRTLRESARLRLCDELYGNMSLLMHKHRSNPTEVSQYFEMSYLRTPSDSSEELEVVANNVVNIKDNVQPGQVTGTKVKNTSRENVTLQLYYAASISDAPQPGDTLIELHQGVQKTLNEAELGPHKPFLNVFNLNGQHVGSIEVTD